jgi:cytochrome P450
LSLSLFGGSLVTKVIEVLNPDVYSNGDPATLGLPLDDYAELRRSAPLYRETINDPLLEPWCWVVSRYKDIIAIDRDHKRFSSEHGVTLKAVDFTRRSDGGLPTMMQMDGEDHVRNRTVVSRGFTPAVVRTLESTYRKMSRDIVDRASASSRFDFCLEIAAELPLQAICKLVGVPDEDVANFHRWVNTFANVTDPETSPSPEAVMDAAINMWNLGVELGCKRRAEPKDDLWSKVVAAHEAEQLNEDELKAMMLIMASGGDETTRNALNHGLWAFMQNPYQMELLRRDPDGMISTAVEEVLRYSSPVISVTRLALHDVELHGQVIKAGERVALLYPSANFDDGVFNDPRRFDITRDPNPHMTFGNGPHTCLGVAVARLEIRSMFLELVERTVDIQPAGDPVYSRDSFLHSVKRLPVHVTWK